MVGAGLGSLSKTSVEPIQINPYAPYDKDLNCLVPTVNDIKRIKRLDGILDGRLNTLPEAFSRFIPDVK